MAQIVTRTVDGRRLEAYPVLDGDLFLVIVDDERLDDLFSREDVIRMISGRVTMDAEEEFTGLKDTDRYLDSGQQGVVFSRADPDIVTKLVFLPGSLSIKDQRRAERRRGLDPWGSMVGSTILAANRHQANLFRSLAEQPGPPSLPRVYEYREGKMDAPTRRRLLSAGIPENRLPPTGWPVAAWVMERVQPVQPNDSKTDIPRRQALDYLWKEHSMVARDLAGDSGNWGLREDGSYVIIDPLVVRIPKSVIAKPPLSLHGAIRALSAIKRQDENSYIATVAPFGATMTRGQESLAMILLSLNLAYVQPDPAFVDLVVDMRGGSKPSFPISYLGYPHSQIPFM
jgi:hypothetical protein